MPAAVRLALRSLLGGALICLAANAHGRRGTASLDPGADDTAGERIRRIDHMASRP